MVGGSCFSVLSLRHLRGSRWAVKKYNPGSQKGSLAGEGQSGGRKRVAAYSPRTKMGPGEAEGVAGWGSGDGRGDGGGQSSITCQEITCHSFVQYLGQCQDIQTQEQKRGPQAVGRAISMVLG